ncbi:FMRFamide receptor-like [Physella acuta]|uniref:FMRFamide receptor-like n=1 Tax=Physella acuta TaxID=109671 RepID=UPI0027DBA4A3|nr:FMRFamide receptor-like [Physella acuta]
MGSIYTTVTLTLERYLIVLVPLKARIFCTFGKTRKIIFGVFLFSTIFNIPRCFFYRLMLSPQAMSLAQFNMSQEVTLNATSGLDSPVLEEGQDDPGLGGTYLWLYVHVYEMYVSGVFFYLLPYAIIPVLNLQLLLAINKRRHETRMISLKNQPHSPRATDQEDGLTMIVLGITACFFVCCLIPAIYNLTQISDLQYSALVFKFLLIASDTMLCINASADFFFYCLLGRKFRNIFLHMVCPKKYLKRSRTVISLSHSYCRPNRTNSETCYHSV